MIDPITIATVAGSLVQVCGKLSGYIITYVNKSKTIESNVDGLSQEIQSLSQVLMAMQQTFETNAINIATLESGTGHEAAHWKNVRQSLSNCQTTLEALTKVWEKVDKTDSRIPGIPRPKKVMAMIMSEEQITIYKGQISAFRQTISLSLQLLTVYDTHSNSLTRVLVLLSLALRLSKQTSKLVSTLWLDSGQPSIVSCANIWIFRPRWQRKPM